MQDYKSATPLDTRKAEAARVLQKHPDRIPIICERSPSCTSTIPEIDKKKYLVPRDMTIGQFVYVVRKRIHMKPEEALFLFLHRNNTLPQSALVIADVYSQHANEDGFLYMSYSGENTFG